MARPHAPRTGLERDIVEAEQAVSEFARAQPGRDGRPCCAARTSSAPTSTRRSPGCSRLPLVPMVLGFDPRLQFVHEDDVVHALEHAAFHRVPGVFNVAADGVLALSEVIDLVGKRGAADPAAVGHRARHGRRCGGSGSGSRTRWLNQLRFGRGVDNRLYKATGFDYGYTTPRGRAQARRAHAARAGDARAPSRSTRTSARWRSSCAGARTCGASSPVSGLAWPRTASRSGSESPSG